MPVINCPHGLGATTQTSGFAFLYLSQSLLQFVKTERKARQTQNIIEPGRQVG